MIGRLDPASGEITLVTPPTPDSRPYGIKIDKDGNPWVACNGSNCLLKVDPKSMALTEVKLPGEGTKVRRLDIADDGIIWYVNSTLGKLGRYDPASGAIEEWDSHSGPDSHPYAIAVINGIGWYNESGARPDMRSEERRVGEECVSSCRTRWSTSQSKKNRHDIKQIDQAIIKIN